MRMIVILAAFLAAGCGAVTDAQTGSDVANNVSGTPCEMPCGTPSATGVSLSPNDFTLKVRILQKECFGSAGCNITFQIKVAEYGGPDDLGEQRFRVVYEVRGGEDGPQTNNLIFEGDSYSYDEEEMIQTSSSSRRLTAKVVEVVEEGDA
jgi:hypothetical protein